MSQIKIIRLKKFDIYILSNFNKKHHLYLKKALAYKLNLDPKVFADWVFFYYYFNRNQF